MTMWKAWLLCANAVTQNSRAARSHPNPQGRLSSYPCRHAFCVIVSLGLIRACVGVELLPDAAVFRG